MILCDLRQLLNFPGSHFCQLYNEGMGSHLRLVIYSSQGDIHTPAHCSARPSFLCTTARTHPGATWQTSGLGSNISRQRRYLTKVRLVKAMVFPVVMYGCESQTIKKAECWRIDAFELRCWSRLLRVPWTARRSNQSMLKEISPLGVHWKDWCWSWNSNTLATWHEEFIHWKRPWCWERLKAGGEGDDRGWDGWMASLI